MNAIAESVLAYEPLTDEDHSFTTGEEIGRWCRLHDRVLKLPLADREALLDKFERLTGDRERTVRQATALEWNDPRMREAERLIPRIRREYGRDAAEYARQVVSRLAGSRDEPPRLPRGWRLTPLAKRAIDGELESLFGSSTAATEDGRGL